MNFGLRKMQISSAAVPPKRILPIQRCSGAAPPDPSGEAAPAGRTGGRGRVLQLAAEVLDRLLQADTARALHQHRVAVPHQLASSSPAAGASATA